MESFDLDSSRHLRRECSLCLFDFTLQLSHGLLILGDVDVVLLVVLLGQVVDDSLIEVLTTKMCVAGRRLDLEDALLDCQE